MHRYVSLNNLIFSGAYTSRKLKLDFRHSVHWKRQVVLRILKILKINDTYFFVIPRVSTKRLLMFPLQHNVPWAFFGGHFEFAYRVERLTTNSNIFGTKQLTEANKDTLSNNLDLRH